MTKRNGSGDDGLPRIMDTNEAAEYIGVSPSTLAQWRGSRIGPPWHRYGDSRRAVVRYLRTELDDYMHGTRQGA